MTNSFKCYAIANVATIWCECYHRGHVSDSGFDGTPSVNVLTHMMFSGFIIGCPDTFGHGVFPLRKAGAGQSGVSESPRKTRFKLIGSIKTKKLHLISLIPEAWLFFYSIKGLFWVTAEGQRSNSPERRWKSRITAALYSQQCLQQRGTGV